MDREEARERIEALIAKRRAHPLYTDEEKDEYERQIREAFKSPLEKVA